MAKVRILRNGRLPKSENKLDMDKTSCPACSAPSYGYDYFVRKGFLKRKLVKISRYTCSDCGCEYEVEELFVRF